MCFKKTAYITIAVLAVSVSLLIVVVRNSAMDDKESSSFFARNRDSMDKLVAIVGADTNALIIQRHAKRPDVLLHVDSSGRTEEVDRSGSQGKELYRLFNEVGLQYVLTDKEELVFARNETTLEWLYPGGTRVFVFRSSPPILLVSSIDSFQKMNRGSYDAYMHLSQMWYVKYVEAH